MGDQASVHVVLDKKGKETKWAVKLAPVARRTTCRKNSIKEINARRILNESILYKNQLPSLTGKVIPSLPAQTTGLRVYGKEGGTVYHWTHDETE